MGAKPGNFLQTWTRLWLRLATVALIGLPIATLPTIVHKAEGWTFYLRGFDLVFEVVLYIVAIGLFGAVGATALAAMIAPFMHRASSRERVADLAVKTVVCVALFVDLRILLGSILLVVGSHSPRITSTAFLAYYAAFAIAMLIARPRAKIARGLDGYLTEGTTRRAVAGLGVAAAGVVVTEAFVGKIRGAPATQPRLSRRGGRNILLITFDALSAEDMSLYGYRLPTTPHLARFGERSTVFDNYYSTSTFTTPSVASMLTGLQTSEHRVYHLQGRLSEAQRPKSLPHLMKAGGFATGAVISNPNAFFLNGDLADAYDVLPDIAYSPADRDLWNATAAFHQFAGPGSRDTEFWDLAEMRQFVPAAAEKYGGRRFWRLKSGFPASVSFDQARAAMKQLPDGYFMWVHVFAPHDPYLPDAKHVGRFLPTSELRTQTQQDSVPYSYMPDQQPTVDKSRLRYDEFLCQADAAFADFMAQIEGDGKLRNTTVVVSADHGEGFEGGVYRHFSAFMTRPQLHVPLMIRTPGQTEGRRVKVTADHTSLAPTLLDLAGLPRPEWMRSGSLVPWLTTDRDGAGEGIAFAQFLANANLFHPINAGVVGAICGGQQYILNLRNGITHLRSLVEAHIRDCDHSRENPLLAREMRAKLAARFPEIPQLRG